MTFPTDIRLVEVQPEFRRERARMPLKFGGVVMEEAIYFHCRVRVENRRGQVADGRGGIFLSDVWAWPTPQVEHPLRERVMQQVAEEFSRAVAAHREFAHPIDLFLDLEPELHQLAVAASATLGATEPMPMLGALVCASAVDAAVHDAFGHVNGIDSYLGYGAEHARDVAHFLTRAGATGEVLVAARGRDVGEFLQQSYAPEVPVFHLVGGLDKLRHSELTEDDPRDDLPVSLDDWIRHDGLFCLKVKLRGTDLDWDLARLIDVHRVAAETYRSIHLTADTNEMCDSPEYMIELLTKLRERALSAFAALLYVEQPTHRDLARFPHRMDGVAALKPVFVDESLTDMSSYELARSLGATGVALKTCKCQSSCLLTVARCHLEGVPYAVQDLTNPSLALLQSVGLAARTHPVMGVEANSRQFFPDASRDVAAEHGDVISRANGVARTASLRGTGLGWGGGNAKRWLTKG